MASDNILISIVIPVKNGDQWIEECLQGIMLQSLFSKTEIIILDSGSTDNTLELIKKYPVIVYRIPPDEFNHGLTRNFGVRKCRGKYIVLTVQDAKPSDDRWLEKLLSGFVDETVAGVCGSQGVPHELDKNPVFWHRPVSEPEFKRYRVGSASEFNELSPEEKKNMASWDDVNAMYLREKLLELPFRDIVYGEDALWAHDALIKGYTLCYQPSALVYHYHHEDFSFTFRRTFTTMYLRYRAFRYLMPKPKLTLRAKLSIFRILFLKTSNISFLKKLEWYKYNLIWWKARRKAYDQFVSAVIEGDDVLDAVHEKYCGRPPIPLKSKGQI